MSKSTIPQYVSDWVEKNRQNDYNDCELETEELNRYYAMGDSIHFTIYSLFANYPDTNSDVELRKPILEWLDQDRNNYFRLVDAVRYGYEVEKEQFYYVKFVNPGSSYSYLNLDTINKHTFIAGSFEFGHFKTKFTLKEIEELNPNYLPFAVKVEDDD